MESDVTIFDFVDFNLISMRYDFQPLYLLRKVIKAMEALSGIGWIDTSSD